MNNSQQSKTKCGLLALLPKPKNYELISKKDNTKLLPQSLVLRKNVAEVSHKRSKIDEDNNVESSLANVVSIYCYLEGF